MTTSASSRSSGWHRRRLAFAFELKGLRPLLGDRPPMDRTAVVASLMHYWIPEDHCVYEGVHKLPAGTWLQVDPDGRRRLERFFDPRAELAEPSGRRGDMKELRRVLEDSVAAWPRPRASTASGSWTSSAPTPS